MYGHIVRRIMSPTNPITRDSLILSSLIASSFIDLKLEYPNKLAVSNYINDNRKSYLTVYLINKWL